MPNFLPYTDPSLPDHPEPTFTTEYITIGNDSIKAVTQKMSWDEALKNCRSDGASLASLRNPWSQLHIELMALNLNTGVWIGLNKKEVQGTRRVKWHIAI